METWKLGLAEIGCKLNSLLAGKKGEKKIVTVETFIFNTLKSVLRLIYQYLILTRE